MSFWCLWKLKGCLPLGLLKEIQIYNVYKVSYPNIKRLKAKATNETEPHSKPDSIIIIVQF